MVSCWATSFRSRPHQGVCDTPLHLFDYCHGKIQLIITPVRLYFGICWFACLFHFRPHQGVCDTPLHMFDCILGLVGLRVCSVFAHVRAYAIRPYTCSIDFGYLWGCVMIPFSPTSGRMRYAPTLVRLNFGICWFACLFHIRPLQGVCDTPLHLFVYCRG